MGRIKPVTEILKCLVVEALPSLIKPYRNQRQKREALLHDLYLKTKYRNCIVVTAQQLHIQDVQTQKLAQPVYPVAFSEEVEGQYRHDANAIIIYHGGKAQDKSQYRDSR